MHGNSKIVCGSPQGQSGLLKCFGYVSEAPGAESDLIVESGEVRMPFLVRDFRGGTATVAVYAPYIPFIGLGKTKQAVPPFNQFELRNVESRLTLSYRATLTAYCNLYAGDKQNATMGDIVGSSANALVQFTDPTHSSLVAKYDPGPRSATSTSAAGRR